MRKLCGTVAERCGRENDMRMIKYKNVIKRILLLVLCAAFLLPLWPPSGAGAEELRYGYVDNFASLKLRSGPGTEYPQVGLLVKGAPVFVDGEEKASDGKIWYHLFSGEVSGYANGKYVTFCDEPETGGDAAFEEALDKEGFPESYKESLRLIHAYYPAWEFRAMKTGLDWSASLDAEMEEGHSLIDYDSLSSWKSTEGRAYNWKTSKWTTGWDSGNWALASREILAYYMDPRTYLTKEGVFAFLQQEFDETTQTVEGVHRIIKGTFMENGGVEADGTAFDYAEVFYDAAKTWGVSPYIFASSVILEVGTKGHDFPGISGTYTFETEDEEGNTVTDTSLSGYYNYFNIAAYANERFSSAIRHGLWYAKGGDNGSTSYGRPWDTRVKAIYGGIEFYAKRYVAVGQDTIYLKKYNVQGDAPYTHEYMTNVDGFYNETMRLARAYSEDLRALPLTFSIPVFENMPDKPSIPPMKDGSPNNRLSSVSLFRSISTTGENGETEETRETFTLTPTFGMNSLSYDVIVPFDVDSLTIEAKAYDKTAKIAGAGKKDLAVGENDFPITVRAENGDERVYRITVAREEKDPFSFDEYIRGVEPGTAASALEEKLKTELVTAGLFAPDGSAKGSDEFAGTGDLAVYRTEDGKEVGKSTVLILGDLNGDGEIRINDLIKLRNHLLETSLLKDAALLAADASGDGEVRMNDLIKLRNHILGEKPIIQ